MQYRLHPGLLIYPASISGDRVLIAEVSSSEPPLILRHPRIPSALINLPEQFSVEDAHTAWNLDPELAELASALWEVIVNEGLAIPVGSEDPLLERTTAWREFGWAEASTYQEATRDYPFLKMDEPNAFPIEEARMVDYASVLPPPCIYQTRPGLAHIELPPRMKSEESPTKRLESLSCDQRRGLEGLGFLFDFCFGERGTEPFGVQGRFLRKTIPSGGARHPTEVFYVAFSDGALEPGVYHYNVEYHRLDCVNPGDHRLTCEHATFDLFQKFKTPPFGLMIFTSLVERAMWRYREARSARAVLVDVGHGLMAFRGIAEALGINVYTYQKVRDAELSSLLRIDPLVQLPLFVGTLV